MEDIYPVMLIDLLLLTYLVYKMIKLIIHHNKWSNFGCTKRFGIFVIVQCFNIIIFRLFYYLERHYQYSRVLASVIQDRELEERAWERVRIMRGIKYVASLSLLALTGLATLWYFRDLQTCYVVWKFDLRNWLFFSWGVCLVYFIILIWNRKYGVSAQHDIDLVHRLYSADALRILAGRQQEVQEGLSESEIQSIEKWQLSRMEELKMIVTWTEDCEASDDFRPECAICIENIKVNEWYKQLPECEHYFHADCIDRWLRRQDSCPLCRRTVEIPELDYSSDLSDVEPELEE